MVVILAFTYNVRAPAWLVLLPVWVGTGLLAPFIITGPVVAASTLTAAAPVGDGSLAWWVGPLVYSSFGAQAVGIAVCFVLYARRRWPWVIRSRVTDRPVEATQPVLVFAAWTAAGLLVPVAVARLLWALGSSAGLPGQGQGVAQQFGDAGLAAFAVLGTLGLFSLVHRRGTATPMWVPLALTWVGGGAVWAGGVYPMMLLLAEAAGGGTSCHTGLRAGVDFLQVIAGVIVAMTGAIVLAECHHATASGSADTAPASRRTAANADADFRSTTSGDRMQAAEG